MNDPFAVPATEPSVIFPVGAILEDVQSRYKILEGPVIQKTVHKYKCEVLARFQPIPEAVAQMKALNPSDDGKDIEWLAILEQNLSKIRRVE